MQSLAGSLLLLLFAAFLPAASEEAGTLRVRQDPARVLAPLGGSVELSCRIDAAGPWERLRVEWQRDGAPRPLCQVVLNDASVSNCCRGMEGCDDARLCFSWDPPTFTLRMGNISQDDVGRYQCKATVEIPVYLQATGNGTVLNTSAAAAGGGWLRNPSRDLGLWLGLAGALAGALLLVPPVVICCYKRCRHRGAGQPIYVNVLFRKKQEGKKDGAQAGSEMKQSSLYIQEFQRRGHNWKPPVAERSPGPMKAPK